MDRATKKAHTEHLKDLEEFQQKLFEVGHTFWHCDAQDREHEKPFYYYQINRTKHMSTCSNCEDLMANRKKIRHLQKVLGIEPTPLTTNFKQGTHVKRMSVKNTSDCNPNFNYIS